MQLLFGMDAMCGLSASLGGVVGRRVTLSAVLTLSAAITLGQSTNPVVYSWKRNTARLHSHSPYDTIHACVSGELADVQDVSYLGDSAYVQATGIPSYPVGPFTFAAGDKDFSAPSNLNWLFQFPLTPEPEMVVRTDLWKQPQHVGAWINGVAIFNLWDGFSYDPVSGADQGKTVWDDYTWHRNAPFFEGSENAFDLALGHPAEKEGCVGMPPPDDCLCSPGTPGTPQLGVYHHHQRSPAIAALTCESVNAHSKIVGFAFDGYPVYGPYAYEDPEDCTSPIVRMQSGYKIGTASDRTTKADGSALDAGQTAGPDFDSEHPRGAYIEDYYYDCDGACCLLYCGYLDNLNGRWCVTPEYPAGTYAYFTTIDEDGVNAFPYVFGPFYYGDVVEENFTQTVALPDHPTQYEPDACATGIWVKVQKIDAGDLAAAGGNFGRDTAIHRDLAAIGAIDPAAAPPGAVFAFQNTGAATDPWDRAAVLYAATSGAPIGVSVDLTTDDLLTGDPAGASGSVELFDTAAWLSLPVPTLGCAPGNQCGYSVAIDGDLAVVGAPVAVLGNGAIHILRKTASCGPGSVWCLQQTILGGAFAAFGTSVATDAGRILVGSPARNPAFGTSQAYLYEEVLGVWTLTETFTPACVSDPDFGHAVDICGDRLVIGSPAADVSADAGVLVTGGAYVYRRSRSSWPLEQRIAGTRSNFGAAVALGDGCLLVGAPHDSNFATELGAVFAYERCDGAWHERQLIESPSGDVDDGFAESLDVDGDGAVIGAKTDSALASAAGAAYLYERRVLEYSIDILPDFGLGSIVRDLAIPSSALSRAVGERAILMGGPYRPVLWEELIPHQWTLLDLPNLPLPVPGRANRLSGAEGSVVIAGALQTDAQLHATVWQQSAGWAFTTLPQPGATIASEAARSFLNGGGVMITVGEVTTTGGVHRGALWIGTDPLVLPGLIAGGAARANDALQLTDGNLLIVGWATGANGTQRPVRWLQTGSQYVIAALPALEGSLRGAAFALASGPDGSWQVAGEADTASETHPVLWSFEGAQWQVRDLGLPQGATGGRANRAAYDADAGVTRVACQLDYNQVQHAAQIFVGCNSIWLENLNDLFPTAARLQWDAQSCSALTASKRSAVQALAKSAPTGPTHALILNPTQAHAPCPGDLDSDGDVNLSDLGIVLAAYGVSGAGDTDGDGDTDLSDLGVVLSLFGRPCP